MIRRLLAIVMAALMTGCTSGEWRTSAPTMPITYKLPAYRSERTVGNLLWLALLPVRRPVCGVGGMVCETELDFATPFELANYLSEHKGYRVKVVAGEDGVWRSDAVVNPAFGAIDDLRTLWESARTDGEISAAVRNIGTALQVDGVMSAWSEDDTKRKSKSLADLSAMEIGLAIVLLVPVLLTLPFILMYDDSRTKRDVVIYETSSGRQVWRNSGSHRQDFAGLFRNLENAVPALVVQ